MAGDDGSLSSFRAVLAVGDEFAMVDCPDGPPSGDLRCVKGGVEVPASAGKGELTLKAQGYRFLTVTPARDMEVKLEALPEPEVTADYRTGFGASGLEAFESLAVSAKTELGPSYSVKFFLRGLHGKPEVYFQNTKTHPLHYDFAHQILGVALSRSEFEQATYHGEERDMMAGTLVLYPSLTTAERASGAALEAPLALSFFPSDDLSPALALRAHQLLEERLGFASLSGAKHRLTYVPAGDVPQSELDASSSTFLARDAAFASLGELYGGLSLQVLNPGLAYGTLRRLSPEELAKTVVSRSDILLLTRLPNELPIVGGTLTEELQTPLAHVNLAARTRGTPNAALLKASTDPRVSPFLGKLVRYEVTSEGFTLKAASLDEAQAFWDSRKPEPFVPEQDLSLKGLPGFSELGFSDASRVGAKAANLAELRGLLGEVAADGFAVPFSACDAYLHANHVSASSCTAAATSCVNQGRAKSVCEAASALCAEGAAAVDDLHAYALRVVANPKAAADTVLREASLAGVVYLIEHGEVDPVWGAALDAKVAAVFGDAKVRLRSSTNSEDLPGFSGAGLYRSVSAWAAGDSSASSRVREVWASLWDFRATEERSYWGIEHAAVQMGVAVDLAHDDEVANGVLITQNVSDPNVYGMYVNVQLGEVEVTNPEGGAVPEVFTIVPSPSGGVQVARQRFSSLSPDVPLLKNAEVAKLYGAADKVQQHFAGLYGVDPAVLALDLEFKFLGPQRALLLKQVRPYGNSLAQ